MADVNPFLIPDSDSPKDRSFIDLSFDGVAMSDLGLTVVYDGTQNEYLTPQFTNNTSTIPGRPGTIVWTTDITNGQLDRQLATDCMSSRQYNRLKQILQPGKIAKLILAQRPYCYAWALIESAPQFTFIPVDQEFLLNGTMYKDVIYRGNVTITWTLVEPYWYGWDISTIADYAQQSWIFESGLPLTLTDNVIYASSDYVQIPSIKNCKIYNAGNAAADCSIKFHMPAGKLVINSSYVSNWKNITIRKNGTVYTTIGKPRVVQDTEYVYTVLSSISGLTASNFVTYKAEILNDLRENLDSTSAWRNQLLYMVQATYNSGSTEGKYNLTTLKSAIRSTFNAAEFTFIIDGVNRQMTMQMKATVIDWSDTTATATTEMDMVQNIEGVTNGQYITIDGNTSIKRDFSIVPITLSIIAASDDSIDAAYVYFINEYE